jgi:hypothetical protein
MENSLREMKVVVSNMENSEEKVELMYCELLFSVYNTKTHLSRVS